MFYTRRRPRAGLLKLPSKMSAVDFTAFCCCHNKAVSQVTNKRRNKRRNIPTELVGFLVPFALSHPPRVHVLGPWALGWGWQSERHRPDRH